MCTVIRKRYWGHPKIAKKDISVYKIGVRIFDPKLNIVKFISAYRNFIYLVDEIYNTEFNISDEHCVSDNVEDKFRDTISIKEQLFIGSGFHAFSTFNRTDCDSQGYNRRNALFIIPKGALYYSNKAENIVSNQIIFKHFI